MAAPERFVRWLVITFIGSLLFGLIAGAIVWFAGVVFGADWVLISVMRTAFWVSIIWDTIAALAKLSEY